MTSTTAVRDRIKELRRVKASTLLPSPRNWRTHPPAQQEALLGVLAEIGYADALIARELPGGELELIDGHLRRDTTPDDLVPVLVLDVDEAEAAKLLVTLDPLAALAEANEQQLDSLLREVQTGDSALAAMLADLAEQHGIIPPETTPGAGGDEFDTEEALEGECRVKAGDLWLIGESHKLICGDCRDSKTWDQLLAGAKVNGVFTSPPYAEQRKEQYGGVPTAEYVDWWEAVQANVRAWLSEDGSFFVNIKPHCDGGERVLYVMDLVLAMKRRWGWRYVEELCWKNSGVPKEPVRRFKNQFEPIYQFSINGDYKFSPSSVMVESDRAFSKAGKGRASSMQGKPDWSRGIEVGEGFAYPGNVVAVNYESSGGVGTGHAAAFPIALPDFFLRAFSDEGDTWVDPFLGSGTVIIAASRNQRNGMGIEALPRYCEVILRRCEAEGLPVRKASG